MDEDGNTTDVQGAPPVQPAWNPTEYVVSEEDNADLDNRFTYHAPIKDQQRRYVGLRTQGRALAHEICAYVPEGRERSLALTKLEEAIFWANAGIARGEK